MTSPQGPASIPGIALATNGAPGRPDGQHFEIVANGYHPGHVDHYMQTLLREIDSLRRRLAEAGRLAGTVVEAGAKSHDGKVMLADLIQIALDEITKNRVQAEADAAKAIADAEKTAADIIAAAHEEAARRVGGATEQSSALLTSARADATRMLDHANAQAAAVTEGAARRLDAVSQAHAQTLVQIRKIRDVTAGIAQMEEDRGSLEDEVARIAGSLPGAPAVAASAPAQLTAAAEAEPPQE